MSDQIRLDEDWHVPTTFSDGTCTVGENVHAAAARGLKTICLVDRVRPSSSWVSELVRACKRLDRKCEVEVHSGVEAEVLDTSGKLAMPPTAELADHVFASVRRLPTPRGPVDPDAAREMIETGELLPARAVEWVVRASANAAARHDSVVLARPFWLLTELGLGERNIHIPYVRLLAGLLARRGGSIELSERRRFPPASVLAPFIAVGVPVRAATESLWSEGLGSYEWCRRVAAELSGPHCGALPLVRAV